MSSEVHRSKAPVEVNVAMAAKKRPSTVAATGQPGRLPTQAQQTQPFFFVDPASSTREKRAHVMRHHIQTKRKQNMLAGHAGRQSRREPRVYPWMKKTASTGNNNRHNNTNRDQNTENTTKPLQSVVSTSVTIPEYEARNAVVCISDALTGLRRDPFSALPLDARAPWSEEQLVDLWTNILYWSGPNTHLKNRIFQEAMRHRTTFQAVVLGYCARYEMERIGPRADGSKDDSRVRFYSSQVHKAISGQPLHRDGSITDEDTLSLTLTGLALQEERYGDKVNACENAEKAKELQLSRQSQSINAMHSVNRFCRPFLLYIYSTMDPCSARIDLKDITQMVEFLRMTQQSMAADMDPEYLKAVPQRVTTFQFDSPLFQLLSSGPRPSRVPRESRDFVVNKNKPTTERARTAALIYIVLALSDFRQQKRQVTLFLDYLFRLVADYGLDRNPACESFMYFLIEETFAAELRQPMRAWRTHELLQIHKRLPFELQFQFNEILLGYLTLIPPIATVDAFERDLRTRYVNSR